MGVFDSSSAPVPLTKFPTNDSITSTIPYPKETRPRSDIPAPTEKPLGTPNHSGDFVKSLSIVIDEFPTQLPDPTIRTCTPREKDLPEIIDDTLDTMRSENSLDPGSGSERSHQSDSQFDDMGLNHIDSLRGHDPGDDVREIDGFRLVQTLGKGGFAWVKKAKWIKSGNFVALKFVQKAPYKKYRGKERDKYRANYENQKKEFETEINCLLRIRSKYVIRLLAYNAECMYPRSDPTKPGIDTFMVALELAPVGELFDILFYPGRGLAEKLARTYMLQIFKGLKAIHDSGIIHRDMKAQNILLANDYTIRITDFGSAYILDDDQTDVVVTHAFGTIGYRAPEVEKGMKPRYRDLELTYSKSMDIFATGHMMFILLTATPPFSVAYYKKQKKKKRRRRDDGKKTSCDWYRPIQEGNMDAFWRMHGDNQFVRREMIRELISACLQHDQNARWTVEQCLQSRWLQKPVYSRHELPMVLDDLHNEVETQRDLKPRLDLSAGKSVVQHFDMRDHLPNISNVTTPAPPTIKYEQPSPRRKPAHDELMPDSPDMAEKTFSYRRKMGHIQQGNKKVRRFKPDDSEEDLAKKNAMANKMATLPSENLLEGTTASNRRVTIKLTKAPIDLIAGSRHKAGGRNDQGMDEEEVSPLGAPLPPEIKSLDHLPPLGTFQAKRGVRAYALFKAMQRNCAQDERCTIEFLPGESLDSEDFSYSMIATHREPGAKKTVYQINAFSYQGHTLLAFNRYAGSRGARQFLHHTLLEPINKLVERTRLEQL